MKRFHTVRLDGGPLILRYVVSIAAFGSLSFGIQGASITALGDLPGGTFDSFACGVSANGRVVAGTGRVFQNSYSQAQAFRWTREQGMTSLGGMSGSPYESQAFGISADGTTVVGQADAAIIHTGWIERGAPQAFRWIVTQGMTQLVPYRENYYPWEWCGARGASPDGGIIVGEGQESMGSGRQPGTPVQGFVWRPQSPWSLSPLFGLRWGDEAIANAISADGSTIVGSSSGRFGPLSSSVWITEAVRWGRWSVAPEFYDPSPVGLGHLQGGEEDSFATAVSADGSTIVGYGASASGRMAFRWTAGEGMVGLDVLLGDESWSAAEGVSGDGLVVVGNSDRGGFLWTPQAGMRLLPDVLLEKGLDPTASGWTELGVGAISPNGQFLVGGGVHHQAREAFLIDFGAPPQPPPSASGPAGSGYDSGRTRP